MTANDRTAHLEAKSSGIQPKWPHTWPPEQEPLVSQTRMHIELHRYNCLNVTNRKSPIHLLLPNTSNSSYCKTRYRWRLFFPPPLLFLKFLIGKTSNKKAERLVGWASPHLILLPKFNNYQLMANLALPIPPLPTTTPTIQIISKQIQNILYSHCTHFSVRKGLLWLLSPPSDCETWYAPS